MIGFLPVLNEDELFGGYLMRLFQSSPYIYPKNFLAEVFKNNKERMNYLGLNNLKDDFLELLENEYGKNVIVMNHTLLGFDNLFGSYKRPSRTNGYLRYCPECTRLMKEKYFQLLPQIPELSVCPAHGCYFVNSNISINRDLNYLIKPISEFSPPKNVLLKQADRDSKVVQLSKYIKDILNMSLVAQKQTRIDIFLRSHISDKFFISKTRVQLDVTSIKNELDAFYSGLNSYSFSHKQIKRILSGESYNPYQVILLAFWLGISPVELVNRGSKKSKSIKYEILSLKLAGLSERKIANKLLVSKTLVHKEISKYKL